MYANTCTVHTCMIQLLACVYMCVVWSYLRKVIASAPDDVTMSVSFKSRVMVMLKITKNFIIPIHRNSYTLSWLHILTGVSTLGVLRGLLLILIHAHTHCAALCSTDPPHLCTHTNARTRVHVSAHHCAAKRHAYTRSAVYSRSVPRGEGGGARACAFMFTCVR